MRRRNQEPGSQFCRLTRTGLAATAIFVLLAFSSEAQAQTAATPAFTPTATTSTVEFYVTLTDSTSGATIYYTFTPTGTTPVTPTTSSSSVTSGGMVLISQSGTLEAMAVKSGYTNSAVASAAYVITGQVAAGWYHTVSLRTDGTVWTWGLNTNGQLGLGSTTQQDSPVKVTSLSGIIAVAAGAYHSVALDSGGHVWTWGMNSNGQLGVNTTTQHTSPVEVQKSNGSGGTTNLTNIVAICAGAYHNLALDSSGNVWAWGLNSSGQLGDASTTQRNMAEQLTTLSGVSVQQLAAGSYHSLLLTTTGTVYAWGLNSTGQVGDGTTTQRDSPVSISGSGSALYGITISGLAGGDEHSVALESGGTVWVWGYNNYGELGDTTTTQHTSPEHLSSLTGMIAVEAGVQFTIAIKSDGTVWTWGHNNFGELGNGTTNQSDSPVQATGVSGAVLLSAGDEDSIVLKNDGTLWVFGENHNGELGNGTSSIYPNAQQIATLGTSIMQISSGSEGQHSLALDSSGNVWAWGDNTDGDLGDGTSYQRAAPVEISFTGLGSATITTVSANNNGSAALDNNGTVWSWGSKYLGNGTTSQSATPIHLSGLSSISALAEGGGYCLNLTSSGNVWGWGSNGYGQLGNGATSSSSSPVEVKNYSGGTGTYLSNISSLNDGDDHSLALTSSSVLYAWGDNNYGEVGDGTTTSRSLPVAVTGLSGITPIAISGGNQFSAIVDSNGHVWTWGYNGFGELGNGNTTDESTPLEVTNSDSSYLSNVVAISCGGNSCLSLKSDGTMWSWGINGNGELGDGTTTQRTHPVQVANVSGVVAISYGQTFALALKSDGSVASWGYNPTGGLGVEPNYSDAFPIPGFNAYANVSTPTVSITAPSNNSTVTTGTVTFTASASESGGTIASVSYYINSTLIGTSTTGSSYSVSWTPPTWGNFTVTAIATDANGNTSYLSSPVTVEVPYSSTSLENWWLLKYSIYGLGYTTSSSPDDNGYTLIQDFLSGANPTNYYSLPNSSGPGSITITPTLTLTSGSGQTSIIGAFTLQPLVVHVVNSSGGAALVNAPVTFTVTSGGGLVADTVTDTPASSFTVTTDSSGNAQVYYQQPSTGSVTSTITATTGGQSVTFSETSSLTSTGTSQTGLSLWLRADVGATSYWDGQVYQWNDQSTNGNNASQSSITNCPFFIPAWLNGEPAIQFNAGASTYLTTSNVVTSGQNYSVFVVSSLGDGNGPFYNGDSSGDSSSSGWGFYQQSPTSYGLEFAVPTPGTPQYLTFGSTQNPNSAQLLSATRGSGTTNFYAFGTLSGTSSTATMNSPVGLSYVGTLLPGVNDFTGNVSEIIVYNYKLSDSERNQTEVYLADKYGLYHPNATWPSAFSSTVQALITANQWNKAQASAYAALSTDSLQSISGLTLWLKADAGVITDGSGNVSQWTDQSNNNNATQFSPYGDKRPVPVSNWINGEPAIQFNGYTWLTTPNVVTSGQNYTIFAVSDMGGSNGDGAFYNGNDSAGGWGINNSQNLSDYGMSDGTVAFLGFGPTQTSTAQLICATNGSGTTSFYAFGALSGTSSSTGMISPTGVAYVGGNDPSYLFTGNVGEIMVYNRVLTQTEQTQVECYLAAKYNLNLAPPTITPSNGSSFTSSATVTFPSVTSPAVIRYTLDGTPPTTSSTLYTGSFTLTQSAPVSCAYFWNNTQISSVATSQVYVADTDDIGISDAWQIEYFGAIGLISASAQSPGGSGLTNVQCYLYGYNPTLYSTNGDGLSDEVNHQLGYSATNTDINGYGLTNAQQLALGLDPFDTGVNPSPPTPPATNSSDHTAPTITLTTPQGATLLP